VLGAGSALVYTQMRTDSITELIEANQTVSFVLAVGEEGTLLFTQVVFYQYDTGKCALFDIPVNVAVLNAEENKIGPIKKVFDSADPEIYLTHLENLLGIPVEFFLYLEKSNLVKLVDLYEGVDIFIPNPVEFQSEEELILLPSGSVTLDGRKAVIFATYREPQERENEAVTRRQKLVQTLLKKIGEMKAYTENSEVRKTILENVEANFSGRSVISLFEALNKLDYDQVVFQRVLGNERQVGEDFLLFPYYEGKLLKETSQQTLVSLRNKEVVSAEELNVTLEILNGTSQNGLAGRTSQVYRSFGYDIGRVGNAESQDYEKTLVIGWNGEMTAAQQVANIIQCKNVESRNNTNTTDAVPGSDVIDVTLILGKDFDGRYCKN
jgi:anionic cell wall polymer biosynthesis LytR-Cps2A-Psr (LCP) family protein